jgi:Gpi18-like mannosyltransferase
MPKRPLVVVSMILFALMLFLRVQLLAMSNGDLLLIQEWYEFLARNGIKGLADGTFSNYPTAYLYLLWFTTLFGKWISPAIAIKLIPTAFDLLSAWMIYKIARTKFDDDKPLLFTAIFLLLPTVMVNSTGWGQIDNTYTSFLLVCFYLILTKRPFWALAAFGAAFSFKAQAIFLLPFLGIMLLRKQVRWFDFFAIPIVYLILPLPAAVLGRSWGSIFNLYVGQVGQFEDLSRNAPNLYVFIPNEYYHPVLEIGLGVFALAMLVWAWINWRAKLSVTPRQLALTALVSAALVPFLLPKMHDRYFYQADVFSFMTVLLVPELWFVPVLFQISSGIAYSAFLLGAHRAIVFLGALINTALVIVIVSRQAREIWQVNDSANQ